MSSNHKAPLAAFVVVALACVVVLATNSMRSYARDAWRQFAAPVVTGMHLVPNLGGDSSTTPAGQDVAVDAPADAPAGTAAKTRSATDATPAVVVTKSTKAKPAKHRHRHHPAKTTPASNTTPVPPAPATLPVPATPTWPSPGPWRSNHSSWPAAVHQPSLPASTHVAANQGNPVGQAKQSTGLRHGVGWPGMAPGKGVAKGLHKNANTPYGATLPQSSQGRWSGHGQGSWGHGQSFGWHRH